MKCKGCGATYDPSLPACPYCGRVNERLARRQASLNRRQRSYEEQKAGILKASAGQRRDRLLNRVMWIVAALAVLVCAVTFVITAFLSSTGTGKDTAAYLETLAENGRYEAMERYLYEIVADRDEYGLYWQMATFSSDAEDLRAYREEYLALDQDRYAAAFRGDESVSESERDSCEKEFSYLVKRILEDCYGLLVQRAQYTDPSVWRAGIYGELTEETEALLSEYESEARATLKLLFEMDDGEIQDLAERDSLDDAFEDAFVERMRENFLNEHSEGKEGSGS